MERMLTSEEAPAASGVKVSTLYAYVSRGLLGRTPTGPAGEPLRPGRHRGGWPGAAGAGARPPHAWPRSRPR